MSENLDVNYARASYHHKREPGARPALLMIDFCEAYFAPASPLHAGVDAALRLRAAAGTPCVPVILTQVILTQVVVTPGGVDGAKYAEVVDEAYVLDYLAALTR